MKPAAQKPWFWLCIAHLGYGDRLSWRCGRILISRAKRKKLGEKADSLPLSQTWMWRGADRNWSTGSAVRKLGLAAEAKPWPLFGTIYTYTTSTSKMLFDICTRNCCSCELHYWNLRIRSTNKIISTNTQHSYVPYDNELRPQHVPKGYAHSDWDTKLDALITMH